MKAEGEESGSLTIDDESLIDDIKAFAIAGSETSSNFITAMLLFVFEKPAVVARLVEEINSIVKSDEDIVQGGTLLRDLCSTVLCWKIWRCLGLG
jgi:cytochrome P450